MQLEDMSKDELIALVKRQEQELAARADTVAIPMVSSEALAGIYAAWDDAFKFGAGVYQLRHVPYEDMLLQPVQQPAPVAGQIEVAKVVYGREDGFFFAKLNAQDVIKPGDSLYATPVLDRALKNAIIIAAADLRHIQYLSDLAVNNFGMNMHGNMLKDLAVHAREIEGRLLEAIKESSIPAAPVAAPVAMPAASVQGDGLHGIDTKMPWERPFGAVQPDIGRDAALVMRSLIEDAVANHKSPKGYIDLCMQHFSGTGIFATQAAPEVASVPDAESKPALWAMVFMGEYNSNIYRTDELAQSALKKLNTDYSEDAKYRKIVPLYTRPQPAPAAVSLIEELLDNVDITCGDCVYFK